ncbi:MAG: hypothetical protein ABR915_16220 [Thermoguttaceae bacterium]|jgi:hypothetical protein
MQRIDLILTFRGMDVPTVKVTGHDACCLTLREIVDGRKQRSGPLLFAYQEGIIWRTFLTDVKAGQYRLTLISNDLHCAKDVSINDGVLSAGVLHVQFNRDDCHRKLFPAFLRRLWWNLGEFLKNRRDHPSRDHRVLSRYRRRFRRGPVGSWLSSHDMLTIYGTSIEFRKDFTGRVRTWGWGDDDNSAVERDFRWQCVGDFSIDVQPVDGDINPEDWGIVEYDFRVSRSAYGTRQLLMYRIHSKDGPAVNSDEPGFWWSSHAVALVEKRGYDWK